VTGLGSRAAALERLASEQFDVLVVGGGINGAGVALDAAARGLSVALVERGDFASGTSSKSGKLIHGGLRYLRHLQMRLVRESAIERDQLLRRGPHLIEAMTFVLPFDGGIDRAKFGAALWTYDALASFRARQRHRRIDRDDAIALVPALAGGESRGAFTFHDCRTDDARLVMEILIAAVHRGAVVANYAEACSIGDGAATVADRDGGTELEVDARRIVVAAGVWNDQLAASGAPNRIRPSKGVHLTVETADLPVSGAATLIPDATNDRMLYVVPWQGVVLVGTTDTPYDGDIDHPAVDADDVRYCLDAVNRAFGMHLDVAHIVGAFAGLRPLAAGRAGATADLSRRHEIYDLAPGVIAVTGGKLTTWRRVAADVGDRVAVELGAPRRSPTRSIRLGSSNVASLTNVVRRSATRFGLDNDAADHLVRTYGDRALDVLDVVEETGTVERIVEHRSTLVAEAEFCARSEMVVHLDDFLARRARLAVTDRRAGDPSSAVRHLGSALGWSEQRRNEEVRAYVDGIRHERGAAAAESPIGITP
jgi:glycerol-3-phosphate dehydrogenase